MKSRECKSPPAKAVAGRPVASVAIRRATGGCRSVHNEDAGREGSAPKTSHRRECRRRRCGGRQHPDGRYARPAGIAGVPSSGHALKGISREPRRAPRLLLQGRYRPPRETGGVRNGLGAVLRPHTTCEGGEPQGSLNVEAGGRGGHGTHWREGANKVTYLPTGT